MNQFWQSVLPPVVLEWHEPKTFRRAIQQQYRQHHMQHWFVFTLGLPFAGGMLLICFPWLLASLQNRPFVSSAPLTFLALGSVFGFAFAGCSLLLAATPATIRCVADQLIIARGGAVERWKYGEFAHYRLTTECIGVEQYRILTLSTAYQRHINVGVPPDLDLACLINLLQQSNVQEHSVQNAL